MTLDDLTLNAREIINQIAAQHRAYNVRVFGSVAKGQANQTSDLDLLVDCDLEKSKIVFKATEVRF